MMNVVRRPAQLFLAIVTVATLGACAAGDASRAAVTVRDSAGVEIVENAAPPWDQTPVWRASPEPVVEIGMVEGDPRYELDRVRTAVRLDDGRIVLANEGTHELRFYDRDGAYLSAAGRRGEGPGEFGAMSGLSRFRGDSLLVWDRRLRRFTVWTDDGEFARSVRLGEQVGYNPNVEGVFDDGSVLVSEFILDPPVEGSKQQYSNLYRLSSDGEVMDSLGRYPSQEMMMMELPGGRRRVLSIAFGPTLDVAVTGGGVFVGLERGPEVGFHAPDGTLRRSVRWAAPRREVTGEVIDGYEAEMMRGTEDDEDARRRARAWLDQMIYAPVIPPYDGLEADPAGRLWARRREAVEDDSPDRWLVFDADGRMLGVAELPNEFWIFEVGRDYVLGVVLDELGVIHVRLHDLVEART